MQIDRHRRCSAAVRALGFTFGLTLAAGPAAAQDLLADLGDSDLATLSLEELMNVEVTTVQGTSHKLMGTPAALYVISAEDIRRSGHRTLAEALRMVPGMFVGQSNAHFWRVGARGFTGSGITSTKNLVMIDGRVVYDPLFSGTFWDAQDLFLDDIDRIEVIRGPGPTLWGVNAMNGVINVITRSARDTQGTSYRVGSGTHEPVYLSARHGTQVGESTWLRVFGKYVSRDELETEDGDGLHDAWAVVRGGFRLDHERPGNFDFTLSGGVYRSTEYELLDNLPDPNAHLQRIVFPNDGMIGGAHLLAQAERRADARTGWSARAYYDRTEREQAAGFTVERDTVNLDYRRWIPLGSRNDLMYGAQADYTRDDTRASPLIRMEPSKRDWGSANVFLQNTTTIVDDTLFGMVGSKLTFHDFVGWEMQPSARLWWTPTQQQTVWVAASRSARVPSRLEENGVFTLAYVDTGLAAGQAATGIYVPVVFTGDDSLASENALSFEAGYRVQLSDRWSIDTAVFHNDYDDLISTNAAGQGSFTNLGGGMSRGVEMSSTIRPSDRWRIEAALSFIEVDATGPVSQFEDDNTPQRMAHVRSYFDLTDEVQLNAAAYYVDEVPLYDIDAYTRVDLGISWQATDTLELALFGSNLLDDAHRETSDAAIPRSVYGQLTVRY